MLIIFLCTCWGYVEPTQYALLKNDVTGSVNTDEVYEGGRHFIGWGKSFLLFPAYLVTLSFGTLDSDNRAQIQARTGQAGEGDDSGGQPLSLSVSFQYRLLKDKVIPVYRTFGKEWDTSYLVFAQQAITDVAQEFAPRSFWEQRKAVETTMMEAVNASIISDGMAQIDSLQLTSITFKPEYEQMITNIQLEEQLQVTKGFDLQVTEVLEEVNVLQAKASAQVIEIRAEAKRASSVMISEAQAKALQQEQAAKATMYARLREHLNFTQAHFLEYIKMNALNTQPTANVKLGVDSVGGITG